eukprot:g5308.t1
MLRDPGNEGWFEQVRRANEEVVAGPHYAETVVRYEDILAVTCVDDDVSDDESANPKLSVNTLGLNRVQQLRTNTTLSTALSRLATGLKASTPDSEEPAVPLFDRLGLEIGLRLIHLADPTRGGDLIERIGRTRHSIAQERGFELPKLRVRDNIEIDPQAYRILIDGNEVAKGKVYAEQLLAIDNCDSGVALTGIRTVDPVFGRCAWWIEPSQRDDAEMLGFHTIEPSAVITTHLTDVAKRNLHRLFECEDLKRIVERITETAPTVLGPASVYAYFKEIGDNTPIDVTLYNIPMFASPIDVPTVQRLSEECERIVAIKDSSGDLPHMIRMMQAVRPNRPDFAFLTGWDAALMPMLLIGCDGGTNASSGVVPEMTRKLYDLTMSQQLDEARKLQYDLVTLFDTMIYSAEFPEGFRAAVGLRGFEMGRGRLPLSTEQRTDLSSLSNTLQCMLAEHGFTDEPIGGCPTGLAESGTGQVSADEVELKVKLRRAKIIRTKVDIERVAVADPSLVEFVPFGPREVQFIGKSVGSTSVTIWHGEVGQQQSLSMLVTVEPDEEPESRRRLEYRELQKMINELFPNSRIQLIPIADKLIIRGQARDEQEATQIMSIVRERGAISPGDFTGFGASTGTLGTAADPFPGGADLPESAVISLLKVPGEKQVMLKVRIAELSRSGARNLGADLNVNLGDFLFSTALTGGAGNIFATNTFRENTINTALSALESNGTAKILAEPNLVVLSGQTANFIAGGQFAVPTVVGVGGAQAATTSFQGFGTQLTFTPTVLDKDRIRLQVAPSFSTLNGGNSVNGIFGLDTRSVNTTVELREGQVLAIAGLLQEQMSGASSRVPFIGDIPLLNTVFSSKSVSRDEKELLILISPELVHPLEPENAPLLLPGMEVTEPDDLEFFIRGHIEGRPDCDHRSTVWWMYKHRMRMARREYDNIRRSGEFYLQGPHGFSN